MQHKCVRLTAFATAPLCRNFPSLKRKGKQGIGGGTTIPMRIDTHGKCVHWTACVAVSLFRSFLSLIRKNKKQTKSNKIHQKCVCQHYIASLFPSFFSFSKTIKKYVVRSTCPWKRMILLLLAVHTYKWQTYKSFVRRYCSVLQWVLKCCRVCCSVLQYVWNCCSVPQCVWICCRVRCGQCAAVCCSVL